MDYQRDHQQTMYHQLEGNNNNHVNHKALHLSDASAEYEETMSNNEDNSSTKDLSPGTETAKGMRSSYADNCDKGSYETYAGNAIRARNFKEMQSPTESSEGTGEGGMGNYMEGMENRAQDGEEVHRKEAGGGNGEAGGNLRSYPSSEDLNQTISSEHGGENITSGSDDEGEWGRLGEGEEPEIKWQIPSSR